MKSKQIFILLLFFIVILVFLNSVSATQTYLNENRTWYQSLTNISSGTLVFGDIDNDGDLDLVASGTKGTPNMDIKVYANNGASLIENKT